MRTQVLARTQLHKTETMMTLTVVVAKAVEGVAVVPVVEKFVLSQVDDTNLSHDGCSGGRLFFRIGRQRACVGAVVRAMEDCVTRKTC